MPKPFEVSQQETKDSPLKNSFFLSLKAIFWSFIGIRKGKDHQRDLAQLRPVHLIIAGLIAGAGFIFLLIMLVKLAIHTVK